MRKKIRILIFMLFPLTLIINYLASKFPSFIETYYTRKINKFTVQILSNISGLFTFSIYELIIYLLIVGIITFLVYCFILFIRFKYKFFIFLKKSLLNILSFISISYFLFILLWGINYNKTPLKYVLLKEYNDFDNININYNVEDLKNLYNFLIIKTNESRCNVREDINGIMKLNTNYVGVIERANIGFNKISHIIPNLDGNYSNVKYVLSSNLMCYTGITGIYFPFTGEANINISTLDMSIPSTTLHEMAHQRGYASEDEANFISYLACINHTDTDFIYSGYKLALTHTASTLKRIDYDSYLELTKQLSNDVINDINANNKFWEKYDGKINDISNKFNDSYLKSNGVNEGNKSYGKMVDLLLTYYKLNNTL